MSKKKHPEHVNHERWLVSYADFITLLFAFFVVLFASGQSDKRKQAKLANAMQQAFSQMALFDPHSKQPALNDGAGSDPNQSPKPIELPLAGASDARPEMVDAKLRTQMESIVANSERPHDVFAAVTAGHKRVAPLKPGDASVRITRDGLVVSLHEGGFFASGSSDIEPTATPMLLALASSIPSGSHLRIEGHTDNLPMHSAHFDSNWELSSARASTIARFLLEHSTVNPGNIAVAGYAEFHPVASNSTPAGRAENRRVDVVFLRSQIASTSNITAASSDPQSAQSVQPAHD